MEELKAAMEEQQRTISDLEVAVEVQKGLKESEQQAKYNLQKKLRRSSAAEHPQRAHLHKKDIGERQQRRRKTLMLATQPHALDTVHAVISKPQELDKVYKQHTRVMWNKTVKVINSTVSALEKSAKEDD